MSEDYATKSLCFAIPVPPSWSIPENMGAAVLAAVDALRANPKAARDPKVAILRAISHLTTLDEPIHAYVYSQEGRPIVLAVALGISSLVARRDEEIKAKQLAHNGFRSSRIAPRIARSDRTVRRRKHRASIHQEWASDEDVRASVQVTTETRQLGYFGDWDIKSRVLIFDAARWYASKKRPLPPSLWWAIVCAFGFAKRTETDKLFTDDAIKALWCVPQPSSLAEAACLVVRAEMLGNARPSNRELARTLDLRPSVVDRFVKTDIFEQHVAALTVNACWNVRAAARSNDPERLVNIAGELLPASSVRNPVRFPTLRL